MIFRILHKYLAVVVFAQLSIWLATGFLLGRAGYSEPLQRHSEEPRKNHDNWQQLLSVNAVLSRLPNALSIELINLLGSPTYKLMTQYDRHIDKRHYELIDAVSGEKLRLKADDVRRLVTNQFRLSSPIRDVSLVHPPIEHLPKESQASWQVVLSDEPATRIYIRASSGDLAAVVDKNSEWINLLMMLHFMDYKNKGSFNHWWIKALALITLLLSITGIWWLISLVKSKQIWVGWSTSNKQLTVLDFQGRRHELSAMNSRSLLSTLQQYAFPIESVCGGGGTCGQCAVQLSDSAPVSVAERYRLPPEKLAKGLRLACQQNSNINCDVQLVARSKTNTLSLELISNTFLTPFTKELRFIYKGNNSMKFGPGSYLRFSIKAGESIGFPQDLPRRFQPFWPPVKTTYFTHSYAVRHYSIANRNDGSGILVFNVKMQPAPSLQHMPGIGSHALGNLKVGKRIDAEGPLGGFDLPMDLHDKEIVLIGGGSGIAPLKALVDELLFGRQEKIDITLFYGAKHPAELANHCWFKAVETKYTNLSYCPIVSSQSSIWFGQTGHVQQLLTPFLTAHRSPKRCLFFLCGPPGMMSDVAHLLSRHSINEDAIIIDSFSPSTFTLV